MEPRLACFPMMVVISSALKARIVFERMLPRDAT